MTRRSLAVDTFAPHLRRIATSRPFIIGATLVVIVLVLVVVLTSGGSGAPTTDAPRATSTVSLAEVFFIQRHPATHHVEWLGSLIIWFLMVLSASSIALMVRFGAESRRSAIIPDDLQRRSASLLRDRRVLDTMDFTRPSPSFFAHVLHAGLSEHEHGYAAMVRATEQASEERTVHLLRRIEPLNIIGNVSPMIGLFGTVYGMILAFREIVASGGTPDPVNLAAGIGTALVTTFWGLIVAIPALAGYAVIRNRIDELTSFAWREADELLNIFRDPPPASIHGAPADKSEQSRA